MKQQFLDLTGLTELVAYIKSNVTDKKEILPYASNKLFPSTGDINAIYIDTATNIIYRWDESSKTYKILAQAVKSISISESTENGKITLTVDGVKTTVPIHGLKSAAFTESSAYSPANHTHTKAQIGLGNVDNTADKDKSVKHASTADSATAAGTATTATNVSAEIGQADIARHVWFSDNYTETKRNYNDKFKYNPATNTVTTNISGSAASANSVLWSGVTNKPSTFTPSAHNHDDSTITSLNASKLFGIIDIARLPHGALERLVIVEDDTARFKLTTANVQLGDTVKVNKTQKMYFVIDDSKLNSEAGYSVYTAGTATSVPWSGVTGKPSSYPPASHNHDERYYTETEMNSKLAEKAAKVHTHVKSEVGLGNVDNTADANKSVKYAASAGTATKANAVPWSGITDKPTTYPPSSHTHNYAGSSSSGGIAWNASALYLNPQTRQTSANYDLTNSNTHAYRVNYSLATSTMTTGKPPADGHILTFGWDTDAGWGAQIAIGDAQSNHLYIRGANSEKKDNKNISTWESSWRTVLDSGNYTSYTVTRTGSGASGTWGISISGNANSSNYLNIVANNEIRFVKPSSALSLHIGYAWSDGSKSKMINEYRFCGGDGNLTQVTASQFNGSLSGNASSATALTSNAGSATQPVYFSGGKPVACSYTLGKSVPSNAVFTDTNTWRGVQNNLTSTATDQSLSAAQGKVLNEKKMGAVSANGYYGMAKPDGSASDWIRTTSSGIIPYQNGGRGSGHGGIGTSSWYFSSSYVDNTYCNKSTIADKVRMEFDTTNNCLNFVFL